MSTTPQVPDTLFSDGEVNTPTPHHAGDSLFSDEEINPPQPKVDPAQDASNTRQMLVSGLTGMPTPNMTDADKASFARGKAAGAVSVPLVAGATAGATAAPEIIPSVVQKAKSGVEWAKANPIKSVAIAKDG